MAEVSLRDLRKSYAGTPVIHASRARSPTASWSSWSAPRAAASRPSCAWWRGSRTSPQESPIGGRVVNAVEPKDRDIAMVFQNYALYPHMSVFDNMAYGLKIRRHRTRARSASASAKAAAILQLEALSTASRGRSRRAAPSASRGRAIVREPAGLPVIDAMPAPKPRP